MRKGKREKETEDLKSKRREELVRAKGGEPGKLTPFLAYPRFNCILLSNFPRGAIDRDTRQEGASFASYLRRHRSFYPPLSLSLTLFPFFNPDPLETPPSSQEGFTLALASTTPRTALPANTLSPSKTI